jgi:hypothetical protein
MRAFNTRQRNRRLQTSGRAIFTSVRYGLLRRKKRDYSGKANPINNEWGCQESGSARSFNVAQSFEPFFDYGSFFSGVLRPLPAFGVCNPASLDGVLFDEGRLKEIL